MRIPRVSWLTKTRSIHPRRHTRRDQDELPLVDDTRWCAPRAQLVRRPEHTGGRERASRLINLYAKDTSRRRRTGWPDVVWWTGSPDRWCAIHLRREASNNGCGAWLISLRRCCFRHTLGQLCTRIWIVWWEQRHIGRRRQSRTSCFLGALWSLWRSGTHGWRTRTSRSKAIIV
jgi:hypothetical protein